MLIDNPYTILNIDENASTQEIKSAYRKLSMKHHPDRNGNCEMFKKINNAYRSLTSNESFFQDINSKLIDNKRNVKNYDNTNDNSIPNLSSNFQENLPPPIIIHLEVDFHKIFSGTSQPILVNRWILENNIKRHENETLYLTIPKGTDDNEIFTIKNKGNILTPNLIGDVKVFIKINNDTLFTRQGLDIIYNKDISLKEALCGFSFNLHFIDGKTYKINNKSGNIVSPNYKKIINNMGLTRNDIIGNLIIQFNIIFPKTLSSETSKQLEILLPS